MAPGKAPPLCPTRVAQPASSKSPWGSQYLQQLGRGRVRRVARDCRARCPRAREPSFARRAALATADIQRTREADSFLSVTPNSPMKAGMSLRVQNSFIGSNSWFSCLTSSGAPPGGHHLSPARILVQADELPRRVVVDGDAAACPGRCPSAARTSLSAGLRRCRWCSR